MADESGGDPSRISGKARSAAQLADAMSGLRDTFNDIMNSAQKAAVEEECAEGYPKFRDNYAETILELEEHGLQLAKNIHSGGAAIGRNDDTTEEGFNGAWPGLSRPINQSSGEGHSGPGGAELY
ncbi:hypothetical protein HNR23_003475 [Nocardiopsis mwathae]|uniref:Uncharacterized protein n=1 Tax=Nocardiopsis mwathae TaxID=1472723 RepID=A0A7W9YK43_9ACTN|nr:hypothetical protein [Nocardiopsis mwathae]MBB6173415.1 hypothetical protein [Nocardiopsis mwathae]